MVLESDSSSLIRVFFFSYLMEIEKGFGTGVIVPEPVGDGDVSVARHSGLKVFCQLTLGIRKDLSYFHICGIFLKLEFLQLDLVGAGSKTCPLGASFCFCQARIALAHPTH
jgi:hypothetical protein